ncbi:MAG: nicotinate phosphoribosyltransferase [Planctomycetota bacterium]
MPPRSGLQRVYETSLALLTDLYQLTMAYGYWKTGRHTMESVFHLYFRKHPFEGGFTIACGLQNAMDFIEQFRFHDDDLQYLATLQGNDATPLFEDAFLEHLRDMKFCCDVDAVREGTAVFPQEPLLRVRGPIDQCQLLETPMLNLLNFQTLVATKAARICLATRGEPVLEFGLRRAQGIDGALAASRAAYVGGCAATSNVLAGLHYGIPVKGTHAHSWVMSFDDEEESFREYAQAMPNNCIFLVDTYDTLNGVRKAIRVGKWLRDNGHKMVGVRLDSGDLAYLSKQARQLLDEAGFEDAIIVASNDIDEHIIASLKEQGGTIALWGVGTRLATAFDQPSLGGVYKLSAVRPAGCADWQHRIKLAEQRAKITTPGVLQVRRFRDESGFVGDAIWDETTGIDPDCTIIDPMDGTRRKTLAPNTDYEDLLVPVFRDGARVYDSPPLPTTQARVQQQLEQFHDGVKRFVHPHEYPVGLEAQLHELRTSLILAARNSEETF